MPWIAAIGGVAPGGGLELAMACRARIATAGARLGLPEVGLGIIPGSGGTVRLPLLVPMAAAIALATGGKPIGADRALALGLVDRLAAGDLLTEACALARELAQTPPLPTLARPVETGTDYAALAPCPLVIEAVFEDMAVKREVFARLDAVLPAEAILATNTSYLDIDALAATTRDPARVLGLPEGYFVAKMGGAERAPGDFKLDEIAPAERRRLAWHLPDDFNRRPRSEQTQILDWVRNVIVSGSTDYRRYQAAMMRQRYAVRFACASGPRRKSSIATCAWVWTTPFAEAR